MPSAKTSAHHRINRCSMSDFLDTIIRLSVEALATTLVFSSIRLIVSSTAGAVALLRLSVSIAVRRDCLQPVDAVFDSFTHSDTSEERTKKNIGTHRQNGRRDEQGRRRKEENIGWLEVCPFIEKQFKS